MIKKGLEKNAKTGRDGVEVDFARLEFAADAIRDNMKFAGKKYGTAPDKSVLLDIEEAIADHEAALAQSECVRPVVVETAPPDTPRPMPMQSLQQPKPEADGAPYDESKRDSYPEHRIPRDWSPEWTLLEPVMGGRTGRPSVFTPGREARYRWINMSGILIERETGYGLATPAE
ncbi:MAG: hypothetical protein EON58_02400 [Alphaproteobacteria bacterium]|nr:MAG: hypothetical protein EON58_02400 [Alphaproteobacteria bacterium]